MIGTALANVFDALEYLNAEGLVTIDTPEVREGRAYVWQEIREKFDVDAAYFHGNVPVVYFKELQAVDEDDLTRLHSSLWNHNRAPLFIVVLPYEIRVYNCFAPPRRVAHGSAFENPTPLKRVVQQIVDVLALRQELSEYRRREIESGRFIQRQQEQFSRERRVDNRLLGNLKHVRRSLIEGGLSKQVANNLLGRSIFVRYLEDREVISTEFYSRFVSGDSFRELLQGSMEETYQLFDDLAKRFNGDLFPVDSVERHEVQLQHLQRLGRFLSGQEMASGQMYFWAYDFKYIPIELISAIYETFLDEERRETTAYYTPPEIVDYVLSEALPVERETQSIRLLDPACGSGIFLVEAYRRLVMRQRRAHDNRNLRYEELRDLLTSSIYGVDLNEGAIEVAAFSCYLALLDFLEPKSIREEVRFPRLKGNILFVSDFFDTEAPFNTRQYDLIVGNPPWQSSLSQLASDYIAREERPVGDRQAAQAFLWRAPDLLADGGTVCLLAPSKGVLFNQSAKNQKFRQQFFQAYHVTQLVDFSTFRHSLFRGAVAPMVAVFYQPDGRHDSGRDSVRYVALHPSPLSEGLAGVVVFGDDVKWISRRQAISQPNIWKPALWGSPRDLSLINDIQERYESLDKFGEQRRWVISEGVQVGGGQRIHAPELAEMRYVPDKALKPFHVETGSNERIGAEWFYRIRKIGAYKGPHTLIRDDPLAGGYLAAAFLFDDAVFRAGIIGIAGPPEDVNLLKAICAYFNSSLARYYFFLTASSWGVERDDILQREFLTFPCPLPIADTALFAEIVALVDQVQQSQPSQEWSEHLDALVFRAYGLTPSERQIVRDALDTNMDRYYEGIQSKAFDAPSTEELIHYAQAYAEVFEAATGGTRGLLPTVYQGSTPYRVISFQLAANRGHDRQPHIESEPELDGLLVKLERMAIEQHSLSLYFQRNVKVFERDAIHIMKPAERRFWTRSAAYNDADETIAQLLGTVISSSVGQAAGPA